MSRKKRNSPALGRAKGRSTALGSIDENLDLGNSLTKVSYDGQIKSLEDQLKDYNADLSDLDAKLNDLEVAEKAIDKVSERMLAGVGVKFGYDSNEYEKGGGTRKSERKRRTSNGKSKANGNGQPQ